MQHSATHCNAPQHIATHCNTLQTQLEAHQKAMASSDCNTLQHTATHCNILQHTASHCNILQHTATHCNTLQHTATHCNTLQHTATHNWRHFAKPWLAATASLLRNPRVPACDTGWRRLIGCLKLHVIFRKRATNYRALLRKMTEEDQASCDSTPPCICFESCEMS